MLTFNQIIHKSNTKEEPQNGVVGEVRARNTAEESKQPPLTFKKMRLPKGLDNPSLTV